MTKKLKFFIDQHGCAKNQVDGELIISFLEQEGHCLVQDASQADLIVINSCGFIESAKKESLDAVIEAKNSYPNAKILLTGCLAQRYAKDLHENLPETDGIFGNGDISKIKDLLADLMRGNRPILVPAQKGVSCGPRRMLLQYDGSAYVKITEGCNNRCTFCAIPIIRGELRSRKANEIVEEIKELLNRGIFEINLIGQDLAAYGTGLGDDVFSANKPGDGYVHLDSQEESSLALLLKEISKLEGNFWIRLLYIHPDHFNRDILSVLQEDHRILPYFDIPFQSGDDSLILKMNRKGSAQKYLQMLETIRTAFPDFALRTTFMTGFPGESEEAFNNTLSFLKSIHADWSGCFTYSQEEDTPAANFKPKVAKKIAASRAKILQEAQAQITAQRLEQRVGQDYDVLIEELVQGEDGLAIGRAWFQAPDVDGSVVVSYEKDDPAQANCFKPGALVKVHINASSDVDLSGYFVSKAN